MIRALTSLLLSLALGWSGATLAVETLDQAWEIALESDRQLSARRALRDASDHQISAALSERLPTLGLNTSFTQLDDAPRFGFGDSLTSPPIFGGDNFLMGGARLSVPLYTGGSISQGVSAARSGLQASSSQISTTALDVKLAVAEAYINVLQTQSALGVADSNVASLEAQTRDARNQYEFGSVPQNDFLAASVSLADARQRRLHLANRLEVALSAYNRRLSRPMTHAIKLDSQLPGTDPRIDQPDDEKLIELALENRPELTTLEAQADLLLARSKVELARLRPQLSLIAGYSVIETDVLDDDRFWSLGLGLKWNLFDAGRTRSRAAVLESQSAAASYQRSDLQSLIALQVRQALLQLGDARQRLPVTEQALHQAEENLRVSRDRYQAGSGTNTEVLDAEALRARSLNNRDNAQFGAALARFQLARAVGIL